MRFEDIYKSNYVAGYITEEAATKSRLWAKHSSQMIEQWACPLTG